jgi:hypothetical protein
MQKISLFSILVLLTVLSGCKKSGSSPSGPESILTSGKWQLVSSTSIISGITEDLYALIPPCQRDNYGIFNADGTTTSDEGPTKCSSTDPQTRSGGNWKLLDNNTKLQLADPISGLIITANIVQLDDNTMKLSYTTNYGGLSANTTSGYKHVK